MKRFLVTTVLVIIIGAIILSACAQPAPAPAPKPTPTPTPAPAPVKPIELKIANFQPPGAPSTPMMEMWGKSIEKETGGKVTFTMYAGETLAKAAATYDATVTGVADICHTFAGYSPGKFSLSEVVILPFIGFNTTAPAAQTLWDLWEAFPEMREQYKETHVLWICPASPRQFLSRKPVQAVDDLKGMKVRTSGDEAPILKAMGATPVSMTGPETYDALGKGVLDATFHTWEAAVSYRFHEVAKYFTKADVCLGGLFIITMNQRKWDALPEDVKTVFNKYSGRYGAVEVDAKGMWDKTDGEFYNWLKQNTNVTFYQLAIGEIAKANEMTKSVHSDWIAAQEKKGLPGKKIYDECLRIMKKYQ